MEKMDIVINQNIELIKKTASIEKKIQGFKKGSWFSSKGTKLIKSWFGKNKKWQNFKKARTQETYYHIRPTYTK